MIIKTKIIAIISLTIILAVGTTTAILLRLQSAKMVEDRLHNTEFLGDIILKTTEYAMNEGRTEDVQKIIENIGKRKEIVYLRILSPDGTILKSSDSSEVGTVSQNFIINALNKQNDRPIVNRNKTITYSKNIPNKQECFGCHSSKEPLNGVIQIEQDISQNLSSMLSIKRLLVISNILIVLLVSIILSFLFSSLITKPLKNLLATIKDIEAGDWNATVKVTSNDELGFIGQSFNKMIEEINKLYHKNLAKERELSKIKVKLEHKNKVEDLNAQLEFKIKELETANKAITSLSREVKGKNVQLEKAVIRLKKINETGRILTSIIETEELMKIIVRTSTDLINAKKGTLHLKNERKQAITIQYQQGFGIENLDNFSLELNPSYTNLLTSGRPLLIPGSLPENGMNENCNGSLLGVPLKIKGDIIGAILLENKTDGNSFTDDELEILSTLSHQAMVAIENARLYENVKSNYFAAIQSLVNALEANDKFTKGHSERVRILSLELGRHIGLDYKELEVLEHASILHDIGKIGIDSIILQKQGKLTSKEYSLIKEHPRIGDDILSPIETLEGVRETIIQHHERYDGAGYPFGLKGEELSLKARILSVVDTFDAMMTDRPYRTALSQQRIFEELRSNSGSQFDPYVVSAFIELLDLRGEHFLSSLGYAFFQPTN